MKKNINYLLIVLVILVVIGCASHRPEIIPDSTQDSTMTMKIKHDIVNGRPVVTGYAWILWYVPILFIAVAWGWKEFFVKKQKQ